MKQAVGSLERQPQQQHICWQCTFLAAVELWVRLFPAALCGKGRVTPWRWEGTVPACVWWHLNGTESSTDKVKNICFKHKLCSARVQRPPLLLELPNTKCWVSDIGLVQAGFVGIMMWNGKIVVACLEKEILCDCLYWSVLSRIRPHRRVWLNHPGKWFVINITHLWPFSWQIPLQISCICRKSVISCCPQERSQPRYFWSSSNLFLSFLKKKTNKNHCDFSTMYWQ